MADHDDFEKGESGSASTYPQQCSALRKGGFVMIKEKPCKIVEMTTSKTGKHGHAKVHITALDIFTEKKLEDICPSTHNMNVPNVKRKDYQLLDIEDDVHFTLMTDSGEEMPHVESTDNKFLKEIQERHAKGDFLILTILSAVGTDKIIAVKTDDK